MASAKALQHRSGDRLLPGTSEKGTRRRYKDEGTPSRRGARDSPDEVPGPKPRSKASGGEGPRARLRPTCRASFNPLNGCRLDVTSKPTEYSVFVAVRGHYSDFGKWVGEQLSYKYPPCNYTLIINTEQLHCCFDFCAVTLVVVIFSGLHPCRIELL